MHSGGMGVGMGICARGNYIMSMTPKTRAEDGVYMVS